MPSNDRQENWIEQGTTLVFSPDKIVKGTVTNLDGEPLSGVSVTVKNRNAGTTTNANGTFTISVDVNETLVFSYVGFTKQEIVVKDQTQIDVKLESAVSSLDQIVV